MTSKHSVVVTGLGAITPIGNSVAVAWNNLCSGVSGAQTISAFDAAEHTTNFAATVTGFDVTTVVGEKNIKKFDRFIALGIQAADEALEHSGLDLDETDRERVGVAIGSGIGGLEFIQNNAELLHGKGPRRISPFFVPGSIINMVAGNVSIRHQLFGPNISAATACTTGTHMIGLAMRMIQHGDADVMLAGGAEAPVNSFGIGAFNAVRALSTRNDNPEQASRPWDADRDGFVLGEGAGVLVLESEAHAKKRGATVYGRVVGFGMSADGHHITQPCSNGEGAALSMRNALKDAELNPRDIGYINAHGTATQAGDIAETIAVQSIFGNHAAATPMSSNKSMIGHLLGAAGAVEGVFTVLALQDQVLPPTINLYNQDAQCPLDYIPHTARDVVNCRYAISNSFGFGGTNGTLIFAR